jgi:hypothetical protein
MKQSIEVSELDFNNIKENLIKYVENKSPFEDYNFRGSSFNTLIDILSYVTHINAINANIGINESFLTTAQFRGSVVNHAMSLGYIPKSPTTSMAVININLSPTREGMDNNLLRGHPFKTTIDNTTYNFTTLENYYTKESKFLNVQIFQGTLKKINYIYDNRSSEKFTIPEESVDLSKLKVTVYPSQNSSEGESFFLIKSIINVTPESPVYFIHENTDGLYDLIFGDGVIGKKLSNGNYIEIEYLFTNKEAANDSFLFSSNQKLENLYNILSIETVSPSSGGSDRESIESIKKNAPLSFISQNRAVTPFDYEYIIQQEFPNIKSIRVWGGEDNDPPIYGKVFISIKPKIGDVLTSLEKRDILNRILKPKSILSVIPEIMDPELIYISLVVLFKFDSTKTSNSRKDLETIVTNAIKEYNEINLGQFNKVFRYSNFLSYIDNSSPSILNSTARVYVKKRFKPIESSGRYVIDFSTPLVYSKNSNSILSSSGFLYNNLSAKLKDRVTPDGSRVIDIVSFNEISQIVLKSNIGIIDGSEVILENFEVSNYNTPIEIKAIPDSDDIFSSLNNIVIIDENDINIRGESDNIIGGSDFSGLNYISLPRHDQ